MIRLIIFLLGLGAFLFGAASNFPSIPLPIDCRSIVWSIGPSGLTLDVILMIVGVFLMMIGWIFHRLSQS
jgi:hypothetical protein